MSVTVAYQDPEGRLYCEEACAPDHPEAASPVGRSALNPEAECSECGRRLGGRLGRATEERSTTPGLDGEAP